MRWTFGGRNSGRTARVISLTLFLCISLYVFFGSWNDISGGSGARGMASVDGIDIDKDLEKNVLVRFDELVQKGSILYEPSVPQSYEHRGFQFEFRMVPFLDKKPISSPNSEDRKDPKGPFANPPEEEIITDVGNSHRLLLNKYCIYRPMLVLPTTKYAPQTDDLDLSDITAAWQVLRALNTGQMARYMAIYNCGPAAGSSLGHKHLQLFPRPEERSMTLFPARAPFGFSTAESIPDVPFKHYVHRISFDAASADVFGLYQLLLKKTRNALRNVNATDYNVIFTPEWIALIPRRTAVWGGPYGANAAGMVGMVSVPNDSQRQQWADLGYTEYLVKLGIPIND